MTFQMRLDEERDEAREEGRAEGESRLSRLISLLLKSGKTDEAMAATESEEIRKQLYAKYGLTEAEQKFIESMIKPME